MAGCNERYRWDKAAHANAIAGKGDYFGVWDMKDAALLEDMALRAPERKIRTAAARQLRRVCTTQDDINRMALDITDEEHRWAIRRVADETILFKIAQEDPEPMARYDAVRKLEAPALLAEVALTNTESLARFEALAKIEDESVLFRVARADEHEDIRRMAVEKVQSQLYLAQIAQKDPDIRIRRMATKRLMDKGILCAIYKYDMDGGVRHAAAKILWGGKGGAG